ncbi:hypothetical protein RPATATE_0288 [Rickettsia parkeri str. Tate's Hell]|uniref:Uncharacterized protein n=1 Tax=Rickettsia parkeri str. Tate's Hell TaxID=1359189 RepID=A0ABR5DPD7_RICPA|nr:hypothetical protein RPAAT24_0637 [Rickettsia parkeri str. AT\
MYARNLGSLLLFYEIATQPTAARNDSSDSHATTPHGNDIKR